MTDTDQAIDPDAGEQVQLPGTEAPKPRRGFPAGRTPGQCHECGVPLPGRQTACDEHRVKPRKKADGTPRSRRAKAPKPSAAPTVEVPADLADQLRVTLEMMADMVGMATGDTVCAGAVKQQAAMMAEAWAGVARTNRHVAGFLAGATSSGGWLGVVAATAPVALVIYQHHVVMPRTSGAPHVHAGAEPMTYGPTDPDPDPLAGLVTDPAGKVLVWTAVGSTETEPPDGWRPATDPESDALDPQQVLRPLWLPPEGWTPPDPMADGFDPVEQGFQPVD